MFLLKSRFCVLTATLIFLSANAYAQVGDFNINGSNVEIQYSTWGGQSEGFAGGGTFYANTEGERFVSFDMQSRLEAVQGSRIIFGAGAQFFVFEQDLETGDDADDLSVGLGLLVQLGYRFTLGTVPTQAVGAVMHSPDIVNAGELETLTRGDLRAEFHVTPSVITYIGVRNQTSAYSDGVIDDRAGGTFDDDVMVGFRIKF